MRKEVSENSEMEAEKTVSGLSPVAQIHTSLFKSFTYHSTSPSGHSLADGQYRWSLYLWMRVHKFLVDDPLNPFQWLEVHWSQQRNRDVTPNTIVVRINMTSLSYFKVYISWIVSIWISTVSSFSFISLKYYYFHQCSHQFTMLL